MTEAAKALYEKLLWWVYRRQLWPWVWLFRRGLNVDGIFVYELANGSDKYITCGKWTDQVRKCSWYNRKLAGSVGPPIKRAILVKKHEMYVYDVAGGLGKAELIFKTKIMKPVAYSGLSIVERNADNVRT